MKTILVAMCLLFLLLHIHSSFAKRGGGGFGKSGGFRKSSTSSRGSNTNTGHKQHGQSSQGGNPPQSGRPGHPGNYPRQQGGASFPNQYPVQGSPYGGYPGSYINRNPNNKVLSPHYMGSIGHGGYGARGGSPYFLSVQQMGMYPSDESRHYGKKAAMAAAGGAMAGMALGYGLGRFPRPHFSFHSPQEEYYYNHYMYRKYGVKSTDTNDYSRDYKYTSPSETYDSYMDSCMTRTDLLPAENQNVNSKTAGVTTATVVTPAPDTGTHSNTTKTNSTATENAATSGLHAGNQLEAYALPPAEDDDTVSIVEIGYPALIEQLKARRCLEMYMVYSEKFLRRETGGAQGQEMGFRGLFACVTSIVLMLLNSNMLLH